MSLHITGSNLCLRQVLHFFSVQSLHMSWSRLFLNVLFVYVISPFLLRFSQLSSVAQSCLTLCDTMDCSMPGFPVHHQLPDPTQTQVQWVSDAIQPSHPLLFLSSPAFNLSQHQGLFQWVSSSHQVAKVLKCKLEHQSLQWIFRTDIL